jgi:ribonuclease PH
MRDKDLLKVIPVTDYVAATSVGIVGGTPMLDLAYEEDSKADVDMNIVMTGGGKFIEVQGTAEAEPFGREALMQLLDLGQKGVNNLIELQRQAVGHILKSESKK